MVHGRSCPQRGCMRMAPSRRITSPLSIGFSMMWAARAAYSTGRPSRGGKGTCLPSESRAGSGRPASMGVSKRPGAMVMTPMASSARERATAASRAATTSSGLVTSAGAKRARSPSAGAIWAPPDFARSSSTTAPPPPCSRSAVARPRPEAPPVITVVDPAMCMPSSSSRVRRRRCSITEPTMPLPLWIRTPEALEMLARELEGAGALAIDTEADSLHHYPGKLCLVQMADARGRGHLVDPLALRDLSPLGPALADPGTLKVLHAADNDLAYLKRLYGVTVTSLFDTAVAARFLGAPALGLEGLLTQYLGVTAVKSRQKDDWSRRPLTAEQEAYALDDVLHLIPLRERLLEALHAIGRARWVEEECAGLAALVVPEKPVNADAYMKIKGARELDARGLGVLLELYAAL